MIHHQRITPTIALTLALAVGAAPAAWADPPPLPQAEAAAAPVSNHSPASTSPCSEVCSAGGYLFATRSAATVQDSGATLPHDPRSRSVALSGGHSPVNSSTANPVNTGPRSEVVSGSGYGSGGVPTTVVRVVAPSSGFDWGDAGIGAGAAVALIGIALAGARAATSRRRHAHHQRVTATS